MKKRVLIPIPSYGFDPSEAAIPWKLMTQKEIEIVFLTPDGKKAEAAYLEMEQSEEFCNPLPYSHALEFIKMIEEEKQAI